MSLIWKRREQKLAERFNVLTVCSENDRRYLGMDDVHVLPNGFERVSNIERSPNQPPRVGFIGAFPRYANVEGCAGSVPVSGQNQETGTGRLPASCGGIH
jgi:hypothetical protein